jgi:hypothetical protein
MAFGETPAPATSGGWPKPRWWVLRSWWAAYFNDPQAQPPPLADAYAVTVLANLLRWLAKKGHQVGDSEWVKDLNNAVGARYAGKTVRGILRLTEEPVVLPDGLALTPGKEFAAVVETSPLFRTKVGRPVRRDGTKPFTREEAGYAEPELAVRMCLTDANNITKERTPNLSGVPVRIPLDWLLAVGDAEVPFREDWVKAMAAVPAVVVSEPNGGS